MDKLEASSARKDLEEVYCYFDTEKGLHYSYNLGENFADATAYVITDGDMVIAPKGYHPTCAIPDSKNTYFWVLAAKSHAQRRYDLAVMDIHAEATSEKLALAHYFDGRIHVMFGTHTHVQTSDAQVLPKGTGYITDAGMTGVIHSVLGVKTEIIINRLRTKLPERFEQAAGECSMEAVLFEVDDKSGKCVTAESLRIE